MVKQAGLPRLRFHDLRHHAITELAESLSSEQTVRAIAGHASPRMLAHYSHARLEAKRRALDGLAGRAEGEVTTQFATQNSRIMPQVTENIGGADEMGLSP